MIGWTSIVPPSLRGPLRDLRGLSMVLRWFFLKPWQNKKGRWIMGCTVFQSFLKNLINCLLQKKRFQKWRISANVWPFLFWQSFNSTSMFYSDSETAEGFKMGGGGGIAGCQKSYWMKQILFLNRPKSGRYTEPRSVPTAVLLLWSKRKLFRQSPTSRYFNPSWNFWFGLFLVIVWNRRFCKVPYVN